MPMARLGAAMAKQQPVAAGRVETHRHQCGHATDKAVDQRHDTFLRARQGKPPVSAAIFEAAARLSRSAGARTNQQRRGAFQ